MEKNTKILLGLGLIGLAYYLWQRSNKEIIPTASATPSQPQSQADCPAGTIFRTIKVPVDVDGMIATGIRNACVNDDNPYMPQVKPEIVPAYKDVVIPKGTKIEGAKVFGYGVSFNTDKVSNYDNGIGQAKFGEFDVTSIVSNERQDPAPFEQPKVVNGYSLYIGNIVNVVLTKDVVRSVPTKPIIFS